MIIFLTNRKLHKLLKKFLAYAEKHDYDHGDDCYHHGASDFCNYLEEGELKEDEYDREEGD